MKTKNYLLLIALFLSSFAVKAQELQSLINYNQVGNSSKFSNITPEVFFGFNETISASDAINTRTFVAGAYTSSQIDIKDSTAYLPGLMLQGALGFKALLNYELKKEGNESKVILSAGPGLKILSNFVDSGNSIWQHNFKIGIAYQFRNVFALSAQYTIGGHNMLSEGEENYKKAFNNAPNQVEYLNMGISWRVSDIESEGGSYIMLNWRSFLGNNQLKGLPNARILSLSFRKDLGLISAKAQREQVTDDTEPSQKTVPFFR